MVVKSKGNLRLFQGNRSVGELFCRLNCLFCVVVSKYVLCSIRKFGEMIPNLTSIIFQMGGEKTTN